MKIFLPLRASRPIALTALALGVALTAGPASALAAPPQHPVALASPKSVVLRLSDVTHTFGSGYKIEISRATTRKEQTSSTVAGQSSYASLQRDWTAGYFNLFARRSAGITAGSVQSSVNTYGSSSTPRRLLQITLANRAAILSQMRKAGIKESLARYDGLGDIAVISTYETKAFRVGTQTVAKSYGVTLLFARGHYAATINVSGHSKVNVSDVHSAAGVMEGRMHGG